MPLEQVQGEVTAARRWRLSPAGADLFDVSCPRKGDVRQTPCILLSEADRCIHHSPMGKCGMAGPASAAGKQISLSRIGRL